MQVTCTGRRDAGDPGRFHLTVGQDGDFDTDSPADIESSNPHVVKDGKAISSGSCTITATSMDDPGDVAHLDITVD